MAALAGQKADFAVDLDILAEELHVLFAVIELAAERSLRLIADEEHCALLPPEIVLEMVADAPRLTHAACREDDLRLGVFVDGLGILARNGDADAV